MIGTYVPDCALFNSHAVGCGRVLVSRLLPVRRSRHGVLATTCVTLVVKIVKIVLAEDSTHNCCDAGERGESARSRQSTQSKHAGAVARPAFSPLYPLRRSHAVILQVLVKNLRQNPGAVENMIKLQSERHHVQGILKELHEELGRSDTFESLLESVQVGSSRNNAPCPLRSHLSFFGSG